jgi:hypothetical protein
VEALTPRNPKQTWYQSLTRAAAAAAIREINLRAASVAPLMAMTTTSAQSSTILGPIVAPPAAAAAPAVVTSITVRLDWGNFALWRALSLTNLSGASLHGFLDGTAAAPAQTITDGTGDAARSVPNPAYATWWTQDQKVQGVLLSSMSEEIASQLLGCSIAAAVWTSIHAMFSAQSRAGVRHLRRQI